MQTVFLAHAPCDRDLAVQLREFLEFGCDLTCFVDDGVISQGQDLISKAEAGFCADFVVLLLSPASCSARWQRERWEPVLFEGAKQNGVEVLTVLLKECSFPPLLRRRNFFDATTNWSTARRLLKRWFWVHARQPGTPPNTTFSRDLEDLYRALADRAGALPAAAAAASQFAAEAADEFEAVLWVPCQGRTLAQAAGELSHQLGLTLDGPVEDNCRRIRDVLFSHRCLVVLDAASREICAELEAGGRTSTMITSEAVKIVETPETPAYARNLIAAQRYAEAYELLYRLLDAVIDPDNCARELTWICERWDRVEEANVLRLNYGPPGMEQLALF
jgi:TIR domain-containing protein